MAVLERDVEVPSRNACVLVCNLLGPRALAAADRLDERDVLVLGDEKDLPGLGQRCVDRHQQGARWPEREREHMLERPTELRALRQLAESLVELLVETDVLHERLHARSADDQIQLSAQLQQGLELVVRLQPLRREARSRALEHTAELDRIVDVAAGELAYNEAAAGERLEEPLVLERHEGATQRRPGDSELFDQTELGNALTRLEGAVQQELAEPKRGFRRLRVGVVPARHGRRLLLS